MGSIGGWYEWVGLVIWMVGCGAVDRALWNAQDVDYGSLLCTVGGGWRHHGRRD